MTLPFLHPGASISYHGLDAEGHTHSITLSTTDPEVIEVWRDMIEQAVLGMDDNGDDSVEIPVDDE
jgi:hypothetical protein